MQGEAQEQSTPHKAPTPAWDSYDAYLFDIDGTLLACTDAVHYFAFAEALELLAGRPLGLDGVVVHGNTDAGILRDALRLGGVPESEWRPRLPAAQQGMCRFVEARAAELRVDVLPGVVDLLDALRKAGKPLGVATGNLAAIGRAKLQAAGLLHFFTFGGYSDGLERRSDVFARALEQARAQAGADARVCVFGDTPEDVRAAHANGLDVVAVATGVFSREELLAEQPTRCLHSLQDLLGHRA